MSDNIPLSNVYFENIFFLSLWHVFSFSWSFLFHRAEIYNFNEVQHISLFFHGSYVSCYILLITTLKVI